MPPITEEQLAALQRDYRRVKVIRIGELEFAIRAPKSHEYKTFRRKAFGDQRADAMEDMLRLLVVSPSRAEFDLVLDEYPGLAESKDVGRAIESFVGMVADESGKGSPPSSSTSAAGPPRSPTA